MRARSANGPLTPAQWNIMSESRFILLDRDGVINRKIHNGYVTRWADFRFLPGVLEALRRLTQARFHLVVISNQAGVGKGCMTPSELALVTRRFTRKIESFGGHIEKVYYCTHRKEAHCRCRKPLPGLLLAAQREFSFDFAAAWMVGDSPSDLAAAASVECPSIMISANPARLPQKPLCGAAAAVPDLGAAADFILARL